MCYCRDDAQSAQDGEGELLCLKMKAQLEDFFIRQPSGRGWLPAETRAEEQAGLRQSQAPHLFEKGKKKKKRQEFMCFLWCLHSIHLDKNNSVKCKQS